MKKQILAAGVLGVCALVAGGWWLLRPAADGTEFHLPLWQKPHAAVPTESVVQGAAPAALPPAARADIPRPNTLRAVPAAALSNKPMWAAAPAASRSGRLPQGRAAANTAQTAPVSDKYTSSALPAAGGQAPSVSAAPLAEVTVPAAAWPGPSGQQVPQAAAAARPARTAQKGRKAQTPQAILNTALPWPGGNKQQAAEMKKTDDMIKNLTKAVESATVAAAAPQTAREQQIEKYLQRRDGSSSRGGSRNQARTNPVAAIKDAAPGLADQMQKNYGGSAGQKAADILDHYAADMEQAQQAPTARERAERSRDVQDTYNGQLRRLEQDEMQKKLNAEMAQYKADYLNRLTQAYDAPTAAAASPLLDNYIQQQMQAYASSDTVEELVKKLTDGQTELDKNLEELVQKMHPDMAAPLGPLNKLRRELGEEQLENMTDDVSQMPINRSAGTQQQKDMQALLQQREELNRSFLQEAMESEAMKALTPEQQQYWQQQAAARLKQLTQDTQKAYESSSTYGEWMEKTHAATEAAQQDIAAIQIPLTQQQQQQQARAAAAMQQYMQDVSAAYGPQAAQEIQALYTAAQNGEISAQELQQRSQAVLHTHRQQALDTQRRALRQSSDDYIQQVHQSAEFGQLSEEQQRRWTRQARQYLTDMEQDLLDLSQQEDIPADQLRAQQEQIQQRTQQKIRNIAL